MFTPARTYPVFAHPERLAGTKAEAEAILGVAARYVSRTRSERYATPDEAIKAAEDDPVVKAFRSAWQTREARLNANRKPGTPEHLIYTGQYTTIDRLGAFEVSALVDGYALTINGYAPAPLFPAGADLLQVRRNRKLYATRADVTKRFGACLGLVAVELEDDNDLHAALVRKFRGQAALRSLPEGKQLVYFKTPDLMPVVRDARDALRKGAATATTANAAADVAGSPVAAREATVAGPYTTEARCRTYCAEILALPWTWAEEIDGKWVVRVRYWGLHNPSELAAWEREQLRTRMSAKLGPGKGVRTDWSAFGLFNDLDQVLTTGEDFPQGSIDAGSGRSMGV